MVHPLAVDSDLLLHVMQNRKPNGKMAASYSGIGLSPDGGTTWLLPRLVGEQVARRFFLENQVWSAEEACKLGAIDEVVAEADLIERAIEITNTWSQWGSHTKKRLSTYC